MRYVVEDEVPTGITISISRSRSDRCIHIFAQEEVITAHIIIDLARCLDNSLAILSPSGQTEVKMETSGIHLNSDIYISELGSM